MKGKIRKNIWFAASGICLLMAVLCGPVLVLYGFMALFFVFIAAALAVFGLADRISHKSVKAAKWLRITLVGMIILCLGLFVVAETVIIRESREIDDPKADYLIVLGAGVDGTVPSISLLNRLEAALTYLERYPDAICVVSGGQGPGEDITEAECMYIWLTGKGIAPERIIMEERATSTEENIRFSLALINDNDPDIAIVSSEYHIYRAKKMAEAQGISALGVPAKTTLWFALKLNYYLREAGAVIYMWVFGQ